MCGPVIVPMTFASIPKCPSVSTSWVATCSCPVVSGLAAAPLERLSARASGSFHSKSGSSVTVPR